VKRWVGRLLLYAPGLALLGAGVGFFLTFPISQPAPCACPQGGVCACPTGTVYAWEGPRLVAASGRYSASVFVARRLARGWFERWHRPPP
jgi:hypothetical protein